MNYGNINHRLTISTIISTTNIHSHNHRSFSHSHLSTEGYLTGLLTKGPSLNDLHDLWISTVYDYLIHIKKYYSHEQSNFLLVKTTIFTRVMAMATSYNWLFLWDYTFYKWG